SDALRVSFATPPHTTAAPAASTGKSTTTMPTAVATPLPPRNRRVTGATCPTTAAAPHVSARTRSPAHHPMPVASTPLRRSPANTIAPAFAPAVRYTFDAPGLPDPSRVGSRPRRRPTRSAVGAVPSRYPSATASTGTTRWYAG